MTRPADRTAAARQRRRRRRLKHALLLVQLELDVEAVDRLIEAGFLEPSSADDRGALADALGRLVERALKISRHHHGVTPGRSNQR